VNVSGFIHRKICGDWGRDKNGLAVSKAVPGTSQWVPDQYFQEATWWRVKGISNRTAGQLRLSASGSIIAPIALDVSKKRDESGAIEGLRGHDERYQDERSTA
jgi:hypothetical protein